MPENLIAYCGVDCAACADYSGGKCPGCRQTDWPEGDACLPVGCCRRKNIDSCGECSSFPCEDMKAFYRESESHEQAYQLMKSRRENTENEKKHNLYLRQKRLLDTFLGNGAITRAQYDKSLGDLTVKMGIEQPAGPDSGHE